MESAVEISNFNKSYDSFEAVKDLNISVKEGSVFGLLGPNGAGKTTTIKAMTGRVSFDRGEIKILGLDIKENLKEVHQRIGVVSESQNLYDNLTVFENIDFFRQLYNVDKGKTSEIIATLSLDFKRNEKVSKLSKGLKQRVLLARSILHTPKLLFLDEPTSGIDPASALEVHRFIREMQNLGTTIFLTSHDMDEVDSLCDDVAILNRGQIVATGTPKSLKKEFGRSEIEICYIGDEGDEVREVFSMEEQNVFSKLGMIHSSKQILSIHSKEASLKDVFLSVIKSDQEKVQ